MQAKLESFTPYFEKFLIFFIILQPILDLITSLSIHLLQTEITLGILVRFLVLVLGFFYILTVKGATKKKIIISYLTLLSVFFLINIINNYFVKDPMSITSEVKFVAKTGYFIFILFTYLFLFKRIRSTNKDWESLIQKNFVFAMNIIGAVMVISAITGTAFNSYIKDKTGHVGWFFAGNELGAIMAISFGIVILYAIRKTTSFQNIYTWVPVLLVMYSLLAVGTKVGYVTVLLMLLISLFVLIVEKFRDKRAGKINLVILLLLIAGFAVYTPFSPIAENTNIHLNLINEQNQTQEQPETDPNHTANKPHKPSNDKTEQHLGNKEIENLLLSGRGTYLEEHKQFFNEAGISQKLFGLGFGGNYETEAKMIEMDFHDLFYSFGIVGTILYLLPILYFGIKVFLLFIRKISIHFNISNALIASGIVIGLGIAYSAGHVLTAPAVSIYLAILIAYLVTRLEKDSDTIL
ncbi:O-antigen ligase family protein [Ferdinandcohnia sp. Marseille-Q9671]